MEKTGVLWLVAIRIVILLLIISAAKVTLRADSASIESIKRQTKSFVREIRSIEFASEHMGEDVDRESKQKITRVETMKYFQSGNMFRSETGITLNGKSLGDEISTYTGGRFQVFYKDEGTMALKDSSLFTNPSRAVSPLVEVFSFLAKNGMTYTWSELTAEKNIDDSFKQATYIGNREYNGDQCIVLQFPGVVPGFTSEVWFSQSKDYFPVKLAASVNGSVIGSGEVKKLHEVTLDGNPAKLLIPVEIVSAFTYPGNSLYSSSTSTVTMDPSTIRINHEIDDDFFTLPTTMAKQVNDIDQMIEQGDLPPENNEIVPRTTSGGKVVFILVNVVLIGLIIYRIYVAKRK